jgi:uncharacterized phage-like protein YoqJ
MRLIDNNSVKHFISGMERGAQQWAAQTILKLRELYYNITLECVLAYEAQAENWTEIQRNRFFDFFSKCDKETLIQRRYTDDCKIKRNHYMIDNSEYVIAAWDMNKYGETYETICYARDKKKKIVILDTINCRLIPDIRLL